MRYFLSIPRFVLFLVLAIFFMVIWSIMDLIKVPEKLTFRTFRVCASLVKILLNIKTEIIGETPKETAVIISNHRSYIDVIMMPSRNPYVVLAKKQVREWPVIGRAASAIGTLFVERDSSESRARTREKIREKLENGVSVLIYPEGTTFEGPGILSFKPGMFHTCAKGGFPIIPVAVEYEDKSMAWIGDDTFVPHFLRAFGKWRVSLTISIGPMMFDSDGESFRQKVHSWIDKETRRLDKIA